ncbi:SCO family protein [Hyalangium versicolor]|uniref:SCO family protein n=1 Tax=Hyalangium versicolor TaxID=2861190 RepID=UPI001CCC06D1|nr:SCO family protein [Hyalangium versicolor]
MKRRTQWSRAVVLTTLMLFMAACEDKASEPVAAPASSTSEREESLGQISLPDGAFVDQDGKPVHLQQDFVQGRVVVMNFIFTRCTTICPPMGVGFSRLRELLGEHAGKEVQLVSVSLDPEYDTPEQLRAWSSKFGSGSGWTLMTGPRADTDALLKALKVYTSAKEQHAPLVLVGNGVSGEWVRVHGLAAPARLKAVIDRMLPLPHPGPTAAGATAANPEDLAAQKYFGETPLIDQDGRQVRFYSDLVQGKIVIINTFFTSCGSVCPVVSRTLGKLQERLGDRLGREVRMLSISVDPVDTPEKLKEYAGRLQARPGWYFLTGDKQNVLEVLGRLGQAVEAPDQHSTVLLVGNTRTGLWKKVLGLAKPEQVVEAAMSVVDDRGEETGAL